MRATSSATATVADFVEIDVEPVDYELRPGMIMGVTRYADWFLIADAACEHGYVNAVLLDGRGVACSDAGCIPSWRSLGRMASASDAGWIDVFASFATDVSGSLPAATAMDDSGLVLGWLLVREGPRAQAWPS